jgi:protein phosphatase
MGGHAAGDVASQLVVKALEAADQAYMLRPEDIPAALAQANREILAHTRKHPETAGMGSTVAGVAQVVVGEIDHWAVFNVGDSRVYRILDGRMDRATVDHSEIEELIMQGRISREQARWHEHRNIITRSMGSDPAPQVDLKVLPQTPGERFLVCTDGLTGELTDQQIEQVVLNVADPALVVEQLISISLISGARDNVSIIVVDLPELGFVEADESTLPRLEVRSEDVGR